MNLILLLNWLFLGWRYRLLFHNFRLFFNYWRRWLCYKSGFNWCGHICSRRYISWLISFFFLFLIISLYALPLFHSFFFNFLRSCIPSLKSFGLLDWRWKLYYLLMSNYDFICKLRRSQASLKDCVIIQVIGHFLLIFNVFITFWWEILGSDGCQIAGDLQFLWVDIFLSENVICFNVVHEFKGELPVSIESFSSWFLSYS